MDMVEMELANSDDSAFITVSRQAYEGMVEELRLYRAIYGALPADITETKIKETGQQTTEQSSEEIPKPENQSDEILSILAQPENNIEPDLDSLEEGIVSLSEHEMIRHYGFKRMKMNHR